MSNPLERDLSIYTGKPDFTEEFTSRDINIHENHYSEETSDETQTQEDIDEGWTEKKQSPLTGRMSGTMEELERIQSSENMTSEEVRECLKDSLECYQSCTETTLRCLSMGGKHAEADHINLLLDCAKICSINADFMLRNSTYYPQTCGICADICDECADNCDRFDEDFMKECASVCRRCAESCREMAR
ncbi:MAG: four-helix bundle copper-binding protein [Candidatus Bathyarchaeia archaeon]|jgi:hypothetical protein